MIRQEGDRIVADVHRVELPVTLRPLRRWSDAELHRFCEQNPGLRIERQPDGRIPVDEPLDAVTASCADALVVQLAGWAQLAGGDVRDAGTGWLLPDGAMFRPDAAWVAPRRWGALADKERPPFVSLCPDFVVELQSPTDTLAALRDKMDTWLRYGAGLGWLIDPDARTVEVFRPGHPPETVHGAARLAAHEPVAGFVLDLAPLWNR